jgi:hypothetical protein
MHRHPGFGETHQSLAIFRVRRIVQSSLGWAEHVHFELHAMLVLYLSDALGDVGTGAEGAVVGVENVDHYFFHRRPLT